MSSAGVHWRCDLAWQSLSRNLSVLEDRLHDNQGCVILLFAIPVNKQLYKVYLRCQRPKRLG